MNGKFARRARIVAVTLLIAPFAIVLDIAAAIVKSVRDFADAVRESW